MKNILTNLSLAFLLIMLGCSGNNEQEQPQKKFVLDNKRLVNENYAMLSWILLSDKDGNPIKVIETHQSYEEISFNPDTSKPYWVSLVRYFYDDESTDISTIKFVDGLDTLNVHAFPRPKEYVITRNLYNSDEGNASINIASLDESLFSLSVGSNGNTDHLHFLTVDRKDIMPIRLLYEVSDCYITVQNWYWSEPEPKFFFASNVSQGDTVILDPSSFKAYDGGFDLDLPLYSSNSRQTIGIRNNLDAYCTFYSTYSYGDFFPVRYIKGSFDSYITYIRYNIADERREVSYTQKSKEPLENFDLISNTFESTSNSDGDLEYNYSGTSDLLYVRWDDNSNYLNIWSIISDPNDSYVTRPVIPETILNQIPGSENWDFNLTSAGFHEYSFLSSYEEAISYVDKEFPDEYSFYLESFDFY